MTRFHDPDVTYHTELWDVWGVSLLLRRLRTEPSKAFQISANITKAAWLDHAEFVGSCRRATSTLDELVVAMHKPRVSGICLRFFFANNCTFKKGCARQSETAGDAAGRTFIITPRTNDHLSPCCSASRRGSSNRRAASKMMPLGKQTQHRYIIRSENHQVRGPFFEPRSMLKSLPLLVARSVHVTAVERDRRDAHLGARILHLPAVEIWANRLDHCSYFVLIRVIRTSHRLVQA